MAATETVRRITIKGANAGLDAAAAKVRDLGKPESVERQDGVFHICGPDHIAVAMHTHGGYLY